MKEAEVKSYTRKTKSGKTVQVRAHSRKCAGGSCADKKGAGSEYADKLRKPYLLGGMKQDEVDNMNKGVKEHLKVVNSRKSIHGCLRALSNFGYRRNSDGTYSHKNGDKVRQNRNGKFVKA